LPSGPPRNDSDQSKTLVELSLKGQARDDADACWNACWNSRGQVDPTRALMCLVFDAC
jgi:hypothetical protein